MTSCLQSGKGGRKVGIVPDYLYFCDENKAMKTIISQRGHNVCRHEDINDIEKIQVDKSNSIKGICNWTCRHFGKCWNCS